MRRLGLIKENIVLPLEKGFLLCDEKGVEKVTLLSIIGKGGTAVAYKGLRNRNGGVVTCIVKEYFPEEKAENGIYQRNKTGDKITIAKKYREAELKLQRENILREIKTNQDIYFNKEDIKKNENFNNSPYSYSAEYLCNMGDSSYIVLDTSEGETLRAKMRREGKIKTDEALKMIYQLLVIIEHLHKKGFVHGDIKPDNLWLRGAYENQSMCLLDFGSAFRLSEYQTNLEDMTDDEILKIADRVMENESIGSNTRDYCSLNIGMIENHKRFFATTDHSTDRARKLLKAINRVGVADDLFSAVKVADDLLEYADLKEEDRNAIREIWKQIKKKNSNTGFAEVCELRKEFQIMETILHKGAHPTVLERGLKGEAEAIVLEDFDYGLLCDI